MSASRSVAAAQRRRAGPSETPVQRGPNTSINSSTNFSPQQQAQQMRPGTTGRLAGQQAAVNQKNYLNQTTTPISNTVENSLNKKMSIPQAITLITLRLGRIENQINNSDNIGTSTISNNLDNSVIESILSRLELLENGVTNENNLLIQQQLESLKPSINSVKNISTATVKEIKDIKNNIQFLLNEILEVKNTLYNVDENYNFSLEINEEEQALLSNTNVTEVSDILEETATVEE